MMKFMEEKMKDKIINALVVVGMVIAANYPLYSSLKGTADDVNQIIVYMREEIAMWKHEIESTQEKLDEVRGDIVNTLDNSINSTKNVLNKVNNIESDVDDLLKSVKNVKFNASSKIDSIKAEPVDAIKDLLKIRG